MNQDEAQKAWENKMKNSFPDYPCVDCKVGNSKCRMICMCAKWKSWFSGHWENIREQAKEVNKND